MCDASSSDTDHRWRASVPGDPGASAESKPFTYPYYNPVLYEPFNHHNPPDDETLGHNGIADAVSISSDEVAKANGEGWMSAPLDSTPGGSPISKLPLDPLNVTGPLAIPIFAAGYGLPIGGSESGAGYYYAFQCSGLTYEINMNMESFKYGNTNSPHDVENSDGGTAACYNGLCDPLYGHPLYTTTPLPQEWGVTGVATVGNNFWCVGLDDGETPEPEGTTICQNIENLNGDVDVCDQYSFDLWSCDIVPLPLGLETFLADNVYEVGNDVGLDL